MGIIPTGWEIFRVKEISKYITAGATPSTRIHQYWDNGSIPWMSSGEVNFRFINNTEKFITDIGFKNSSTSLIPKQSVLMALAGQGKTRGKVAINNIELTTNQSLAAIIPNDSLHYKYLFYNLESRYDDLRRLSSGEGGRGGLNLQIIKTLPILLPPLEEQKKIAEILSTWDSTIELYEKLVIQKQLEFKAKTKLLLSGKKRLGIFHQSWNKFSLSNLLTNLIRKRKILFNFTEIVFSLVVNRLLNKSLLSKINFL